MALKKPTSKKSPAQQARRKLGGVATKKKPAVKPKAQKEKSQVETRGRKKGTPDQSKGRARNSYNRKSKGEEDLKTTSRTIEEEETRRVHYLEAEFKRTRPKTMSTKAAHECKHFLKQLLWHWRMKGKTFQQMAEMYDISIGQAYALWKEIATEVYDLSVKDKEFYISMDLMQIDEMIFALNPYCSAHERTEIVTRRKGSQIITKEVLVKYPPSVEAIDRKVKLMERRSKLLGMDKPVKNELEVTERPYVALSPGKAQSTEEWAEQGGVEVRGPEEEKQVKDSEAVIRH